MSKMRFLVLLALCTLFVAAAHAQVTYQITSTPTFVINTGRSEVVGSVRITAMNTAATVASQVQVLFQGMSCDNDFTSGMQFFAGSILGGGNSGVFNPGTVAVPPPPSTPGATGIAAPSSPTVTNTSAGCIVLFNIPTSVGPAVGDFLEVQGVRGRIDFLGGVTNIGQNVNASLNATPSNSSLFTAPTTVVVATTQKGLTVGTITPTSILQCVGSAALPSIVLTEGFNGAFVQHVLFTGAAVPTAARPVFGGLNNTRIIITLTTLPTGVTVTWPGLVNSTLGAYVSATSGSELALVSQNTSGSTATYQYACGNQGACDIAQESFTVAPTAVTALATAAFGTGTIQAQLGPPLATTGEATALTSAPLPATTFAKPRFNDPLQPSPGTAFITTAPCATNLIFPFVTNLAGFDTGIVIANTSIDPLPALNTANAQTGTCTITGYPQVGGTAVTFTTGTIVAGTTFTTVLSDAANTALNAFQGYLFVRCNFQFAHGFAYITDGFRGTPTRSMGFVPLIVPDPVVVSSTTRRAAPLCATTAAGCIPNTGEGLKQ